MIKLIKENSFSIVAFVLVALFLSQNVIESPIVQDSHIQKLFWIMELLLFVLLYQLRKVDFPSKKGYVKLFLPCTSATMGLSLWYFIIYAAIHDEPGMIPAALIVGIVGGLILGVIQAALLWTFLSMVNLVSKHFK